MRTTGHDGGCEWVLEQWFEHCPNSQAKQKTGPAECLYKALALLIAVLLLPSFITAAPQAHEPVERTHESSPATSLPMEGGHELQVWVAGAPILSVDGSSNDGNYIIELGARYGWILTDVHMRSIDVWLFAAPTPRTAFLAAWITSR